MVLIALESKQITSKHEGLTLNEEFRKKMSNAESLFEKGEFKEALKIVEMLAKQNGLSVENRIASSFLEIRIRIRLGNLKEVQSMIEDTLQDAYKINDPLQITDILIIKAEVCWRLGELDQGLKVVEEGEKILIDYGQENAEELESEVNPRLANLLNHGGIIIWYKGDFDRAFDYHQKSLAIKKELGNKESIARSLNNLGLVLYSKSDFDKALEYYLESLIIWEELDNKREMAKTLLNLSNVYSYKGNLDRAQEYVLRSLKIGEKLGNKRDFALSLNNLGAICERKGDLDKAMEYYQQSLAIHEELGSKHHIALGFGNVGGIYLLKGDLDEALKYQQQSLEMFERAGMKEDIARTLSNIGDTYRRKGESEQAITCYQRSLELNEEMQNNIQISTALCELVCIALDENEMSLAKQHLEKLQQINARTDNPFISQRYRVANALSLKAGKRARDMFKAAEILEQLVEEDVIDHSLTVTAMIHLCDLLLSELKMTGEDGVLRRINDLANQLLEIAKSQASHSLLAETYLLQSKLALIDLDVEKAKELLVQAYDIADEKGLGKLASAVAHERELLSTQLQKWESILEFNPSRREMIDYTHLNGYLEKMIRKTVATMTKVKEPTKKYEIVHLDLLKDSPVKERSKFRVGIAQISKSQHGDIVSEFYIETATGLFRIREDKLDSLRTNIKNMVDLAKKNEIDLLLFPELTLDLAYEQIRDDLSQLSKSNGIYIIPGSYHHLESMRNISSVIGPKGVLWEQEKHIPASIYYEGKRIEEGIQTGKVPSRTIVCNTEFGRIAIVICRDFLDMDLRVELKNSEPPVDLIFNPAFTPVTEDFRAAHFDARRSIYAYCFFANVAEFGDSLIYSPEKDRQERAIPKGEEDIIFKDVDLFQLRSERKRWEKDQKKQRSFIQSTR